MTSALRSSARMAVFKFMQKPYLENPRVFAAFAAFFKNKNQQTKTHKENHTEHSTNQKTTKDKHTKRKKPKKETKEGNGRRERKKVIREKKREGEKKTFQKILISASWKMCR